MNEKETKQEKREKKLEKKRRKMPQHGRTLSKVYKDSILKKAKPDSPTSEPSGA